MPLETPEIPEQIELAGWRKTLAQFIGNIFGNAILFFLHLLGKAFKPLLLPMLREWHADPKTPAYAKTLLDRWIREDGEWQGILAGAAGGSAVGGAVSSSMASPLEWIKQKSYIKMPITLYGLGELVGLFLRKKIEEPVLRAELLRYGFDKAHQDGLIELMNIMPPATDVITWSAREVFEPELREFYEIDKYLPADYLAWAAKVGIIEEVAKNYWAAHWALPGMVEMMELLRRGQLGLDKTEFGREVGPEEILELQSKGLETLDKFWTELDMVPWIRNALTALTWAVPTRVDIRRFWDMGTIDEPRLRMLYAQHGYHGKDLEDYMLWTKVYTAFPDLMARFRNGWVTSAQVVSELVALGMTPEKATMFLETKMKAPVGEERVEKERDLTKSEIYAGVKKEVITWEEGLTMLQALGYDAEEAKFILEIRVGAGASPETYLELMKWVQDWRKATGMEAKEIPEELIAKEKEYRAIIAEHETAIKEGASQAKIDTLGEKRATIEYQYRQMLKLSGLS